MSADEAINGMPEEPRDGAEEAAVKNNHATAIERDEDASAAQAQVIASLRAQVTDLFTQVTQLNSKLVASYDRVSDLEDQLHESSSSLRNASITISSLELERSEHLAALNTGLLVEKAHVTAELNRLMERATEEAAQRGQAESARHDIEKDLDDLSATLFDQANTMVAEARLSQARSERKVQEAEEALRGAEEAVKVMQAQMQALEADKRAAEKEALDAQITMGKGKWVEQDDPRGDVSKMRFLTTHTPYSEFVSFLSYLRSQKSSQSSPPAIPSLLNQPFLARLVTEDSEPTVRLDLAPSLNWLSRRSVLTAIHAGMLTVEPISFASLVQELSSQSQSCPSVSCALCGTHIARLASGSAFEKPPSHPLAALARSSTANANSWFKYPLALSSSTHVNGISLSQSEDDGHPEHVHVFRVTTLTSSQPPPPLAPISRQASISAPSTSRPPVQTSTTTRVLPTQSQNPPYPLCTSNYCLLRLRTTCSLWAFVRTGIIERVWEEEVFRPPRLVEVDKLVVNGHRTPKQPSTPTASRPTSPGIPDKPPVPPRRRRLWEMASALGERAASWGKDGGERPQEKEKEKEKGPVRRIPPPLSAPHPPKEAAPIQAQVPPPLPKRSGMRNVTAGGATVDANVEATSNEAVVTEEPATVDSAMTYTETQQDNNASSESFTTPTEEVNVRLSTSSTETNAKGDVPADVPREQPSSPVQANRSPSPRTVPLPQTPTSPRPRSRVGSPVPQVVASPMALSRSRAGSPAPSRTASPAPGHTSSPAPGRTASPFPPSRTGSPAPHTAPPVPRRAPARRAAPLPPPTPGASERPTSPATSRLKKEIIMASEEPEVPPQEGSSPPQPAKEATEIPAANGGGESAVGSSTVLPLLGTEPTQHVNAPLDTPPEPAVPLSGRAASSEEIVPVEPTPTIQNMISAPSIAHDPTPATSTESAGRSSTETESSTRALNSRSPKSPSITDGEGFASEATWEERTWKELVRLRGEMFWARVGCVRDS
ncbi:hypothetical protein ID866_3968 [Astraeus odoratus]|nr:hypothetical protein ID866_3968 [Astraeus odoratus]